MLHRSPARRPRGSSLIETMIAMAIFGVGMLGVIQAQILVARQNGLARRHSRAAAIARDFVESAQRWEYADPRLASPACGPLPAGFPVLENAVGSARTPAIVFDFTATPPAYASAATEGVTTDALTLGGTVPYDGAVGVGPDRLLGNPDRDRYQLLWTVRQVQTNTLLTGCQAKLISVVVRYPTGNGDNYRNIVTSFIKHDTSTISVGGVAELF